MSAVDLFKDHFETNVVRIDSLSDGDFFITEINPDYLYVIIKNKKKIKYKTVYSFNNYNNNTGMTLDDWDLKVQKEKK